MTLVGLMAGRSTDKIQKSFKSLKMIQYCVRFYWAIYSLLQGGFRITDFLVLNDIVYAIAT